MEPPRPTARTGGVAERLRRLDAEAFVAFCAALWSARGYETRQEGDRFVARRGDERLVVRPLSAPGMVGRLVGAVRPVGTRLRGVAPGPDPASDSGHVDVVVTPVDDARAARLADRHDARLVGPATLVDLLLYGVARSDADALATEYLGASTTTLLTERASTRGASSRWPAVTALAAVAGVVCLVLAAGVAGVWGPTPTETPDDVAPPLLTGAGFEPERADDPSAVAVENGSTGSSEPTGPSASVARYPPGVGDGSLDAETLARAHATAVSGRSYRLIVRQSDTDALDGEWRWDGVWQHTVVANESRWLYTVVGYEARENGSELVQYTLYTEGESVYRRADSRDGSRYERLPPRVDDDGFGTHADRTRRYVVRYLTTTDVAVDRVSWRPDEYRIVATGRPRYVDGDVSNYTATAFVDESGFVSELTVEFTREDGRDADDTSARFRMEYAAVDETDLRPPGWYDEARAVTATNTTATNTTAT